MFNAAPWKRAHELARTERRLTQFWEDVRGEISTHSDSEWRIADVWDHFVEDGRELRDSFNPRHGGGSVNLREAGVDTGSFANITGQFMYNAVLDAFNFPGFIGDMLATTVSTQFENERIPGVTQLGDDTADIGEGKPYPLAGVTEEWIDTPRTTKSGVIVPITKEAIFFDRTGLVLDRARQVAQSLGFRKEKRILDTALGITTSYRRNGGAAIATYNDVSGAHDWDNLVATNALVDWTDIENALLAFDAITDPGTGEPVIIPPSLTVVVPTALLMTARRVLNATEIRFGDGASATTQTIAANPVAGAFNIVSNAYVKARTSSASTWFIGDFRAAFVYMQNWPITVTQAPANSEAEFTNDIVARFKVSERGVPAVREPRKVVKNTA